MNHHYFDIFFFNLLFTLWSISLSLENQNNNSVSLHMDGTDSRIKCLDNSYLKGKWLHNKNRSKSFHCCGYDDGDYLHDSEICHNTEGSGNPNRYGFQFQGSNSQLAYVGSRGCRCDARGIR